MFDRFRTPLKRGVGETVRREAGMIAGVKFHREKTVLEPSFLLR